MATRFPVYQIDFQAVASGKMIASSKRKVRWRFGFPNQQAMAAGRTGVDCRGEEHDIVVIWSVTSGKRQVYMDGTEIHFSSSRAGIFQYSWSAKGNHVMKVVAHASPPISATPGFRQYDLWIDGQSFFTMPKAYELGIRGRIPSHARVPGSYGQSSGVRAPNNREQEDSDLQRAISASLQESRQFLANKEHDDRSAVAASPAAPAVADLMDLGGQQGTPQPKTADSQTVMSYNTMPPRYGTQPNPQYAAQPPANPYQPAPGYATPQQQPPHYQKPPPSYRSPPQPQSSSALVPSGVPSNQYGNPPPAQPVVPAYMAPPAYATASQPAPPVYGVPPAQPAVPTGNLFAPSPVDPFTPAAPPPGDPFGFSQPVPPVDDPFAPKPPPQPTRDDITNSILSAYGGQPPAPTGHPAQTGQHVTIANGQAPANGMPNGGAVVSMNGGYHAPAAEPVKQLSELEKAMKRLVNVDRIDEPAEQEYKLTMAKKEEPKKDGKSRGVAPVATGLVGSHATLDHIKEVKPHTPKNGEGVMRAPPQLFHPDVVHAGALVVHGQGPPPIQRGFGIGYGAPPPQFQQQRW